MFIKNGTGYINLSFACYYLIEDHELIVGNDGSFDVCLDQNVQDKLKEEGWVVYKNDDVKLLINPKKIEAIDVEELDVEIGFFGIDSENSIVLTCENQKAVDDLIISITPSEYLINTGIEDEDEIDKNSLEEATNQLRDTLQNQQKNKTTHKKGFAKKEKHDASWTETIIIAVLFCIALIALLT